MVSRASAALRGHGGAASVSLRVTPEDSDFVAKGALSYADTSTEAQAWFGSPVDDVCGGSA